MRYREPNWACYAAAIVLLICSLPMPAYRSQLVGGNVWVLFLPLFEFTTAVGLFDNFDLRGINYDLILLGGTLSFIMGPAVMVFTRPHRVGLLLRVVTAIGLLAPWIIVVSAMQSPQTRFHNDWTSPPLFGFYIYAVSQTVASAACVISIFDSAHTGVLRAFPVITKSERRKGDKEI